jgi:predicted permease
MPARKDDWSTRAYRALLSLYPAAFRDEYQRELTLLFIDRYRDAAGPGDRARLWFEALGGIAAEAPKEHYSMMVQDLRYALRMLRKHLLVTSTIVITLGLGIGVNTAIFSLLNAVVLRTLPVADPDRLFAVRAPLPIASGNRFSGPMFERLRQYAPDGVDIAAMSRVARVHTRVDGSSEPESAALQLVSANYFDVLGLRLHGHPLPENAPGSFAPAPVAIVSHGYWQRRFAGADGVLGRTLTINGTSYTIAGVAAPGFAGVWLEFPVDVWVPLSMQQAVKYSQNFSADRADQSQPWMTQERIWWLDVIVRARPEGSAATEGALNAGLQDLANSSARVVLEPFARGFSLFRQQFDTPLLVLIVMAALVLLVACANVANLLLARAAARQREIAVRMSMGAGRLRLVQQLLTESVILVMLAGVAAVLFARWAGDLLLRTATASATGPAPFTAALDLRVLGFTAAVALASVVLFGLLPAWRTTRLDIVGALKTGGRGTVGPAARPARLLVVLQVALSLVLVTATGLLGRSFHNLMNVDVGFDRQRLLSVTIDPRLAGIQPEEMPGLQRRVRDSVAALPEVGSVSLAMCGVQGNCRAREDGFEIEGYQPAPDEQVVFLVNSIDPNYFSTMGMRLVAGRTFADHDRAKSPRVAIVNRTLAARYFKDGHALGRHFGQSGPDVEIVGIVDDARLLNVKDGAVPTAFFPLEQRPIVARVLEVRTKGQPAHAIAAVRRAVGQAAPNMPIGSVSWVDERISASLSQERVVMFLASGFGALALGLAGFGLFGVLSYAVARRTSEFGIRMALGASRSHVLWSVVREALWLVVTGFVVGAPIVLLGGDLASTLFFGVSPRDWSIFLAATATLLIVGVICSLFPALRAARVEPVVALRQE